MYGDITFRAAEQLRKPEVVDFFASLIQRVSPKSYQQAAAEVNITRQFLDNFGGDQVRWLWFILWEYTRSCFLLHNTLHVEKTT